MVEFKALSQPVEPTTIPGECTTADFKYGGLVRFVVPADRLPAGPNAKGWLKALESSEDETLTPFIKAWQRASSSSRYAWVAIFTSRPSEGTPSAFEPITTLPFGLVLDSGGPPASILSLTLVANGSCLANTPDGRVFAVLDGVIMQPCTELVSDASVDSSLSYETIKECVLAFVFSYFLMFPRSLLTN
jgi:hypothetical protein